MAGMEDKIKGLEEKGDVGGLEEIKNEAEMSLDGQTIKDAEDAISRLNAKVAEVSPKVETTPNQEKQVAELGGSEADLQAVTGPKDVEIANVDQEIKNIQTDAEQRIKSLKSETIPLETNEKPAVNPELLKELEDAKGTLEYWRKQRSEIYSKQGELQNYDEKKESLQKRLDSLSEDENKYKDLLDKQIVVYPNTEKAGRERIAFKELSERDNSELQYNRDIGTLATKILSSYDNYDNDPYANPQRVFQFKNATETTLKNLLGDYKKFLENALTIPNPTLAQIDANQQEVNRVSESYNNSRKKVEELEATISKPIL